MKTEQKSLSMHGERHSHVRTDQQTSKPTSGKDDDQRQLPADSTGGASMGGEGSTGGAVGGEGEDETA